MSLAIVKPSNTFQLKELKQLHQMEEGALKTKMPNTLQLTLRHQDIILLLMEERALETRMSNTLQLTLRHQDIILLLMEERALETKVSNTPHLSLRH